MVGSPANEALGIDRKDMASEHALLARWHVKIAPRVRVGWQGGSHGQDDRQRAKQRCSTLTCRPDVDLLEIDNSMEILTIADPIDSLELLLEPTTWRLAVSRLGS
jgi:hypothetical protein